jgi:uncharacterized protein YvpB|nr:MAG TPA: peptidase [Caudoviricetes sp.]
MIAAALTAALAAYSPADMHSVYEDVLDPSDRVGVARQKPDYPAGCEPMSLVIVLKSYGYDATMPEILALMDYSEWSFADSFWGSPFDVGAVYPKGLANAANRYLEIQGSGLKAVGVTGMDYEVLALRTKHGLPAICWFTTDYEDPRWTGWADEGLQMYENEHALVLYGFDGDGYALVSDPLRGRSRILESRFEEIWEECGGMAVVLTKEED